MKEKDRSLVFGMTIIILGMILLFHNTRIIPSFENFFGGIFFLLAAFICFHFYKQNSKNWWALIPALFFFLFGVALIFKNFYFFRDDLIGITIFWCAALVFGYIFYRDKKKWWAVIPSGGFFTLGTVVFLDVLDLVRSGFDGVVFFLGTGLTFLYLWTLANNVNKLKWAIYPAVACLLLSVFLFVETTTRHGFDLLISIILICIGLYFIIRPSKKK
ncbi:hypothetical protein JXQ31_01545 [candidate division KSB1 bacterium]|nr:hypothetical protein [candidate division KSB1 bacterium]